MTSSIIIPTAGRPFAVRTAIGSLLAASHDRQGVEILVVDNNTQDDLAIDLRDYCVSLNGQVRYVQEPSPGATAARHRGAIESRGELLIFVDDDVEVSEGWLDAIQRGFEDPDVGLIGGPTIPKFDESVPAWFWRFLSPTPYGGWTCSWLSLLDIGQSVKGIDPNYIWSLNLSIRRSIFERFRGFHPGLVPLHLQRWQGDEETGLTMKISANGIRADYVKEALSFHHCGPDRLNPQYFAKRAFYQGVCDSFARIRAGQAPESNSTPSAHQSIYRKLARTLLRRLPRYGSPWTKEGAATWEMAQNALLAGWRFHQAEVAADPKLLAWVRRADFWDADIRTEMT